MNLGASTALDERTEYRVQGTENRVQGWGRWKMEAETGDRRQETVRHSKMGMIAESSWACKDAGEECSYFGD
jgi:hypothetical protein